MQCEWRAHFLRRRWRLSLGHDTGTGRDVVGTDTARPLEATTVLFCPVSVDLDGKEGVSIGWPSTDK